MKKIIVAISILCLICMSSCNQIQRNNSVDVNIGDAQTKSENNELLTSSDEILEVFYEPVGFGAKSLSDFYNKLSQYNNSSILNIVNLSVTNNSISINPVDIIINAQSFSFDGYEVYSAGFDRAVDTNGLENGSEMIELYWHPEDCQTPYDVGCYQFKLNIVFKHKGVDIPLATQGYSANEQSGDDYFTKEIGDNKISHVVLINDNIYCRFQIDRYCPDYTTVKSTFLNYCNSLKKF